VDERKKIRIMISIDKWTPVCRDVFEKVLPCLDSTLSQILYLMLYDKIWHNRRGMLRASVQDMVRWTDADWRTVNKTLGELIRKGFVDCPSLGHTKSRSDKPQWQVPAADFDMKTEGPWTAVPRFLIWEYARAYRNSLLATILLWHQDFGGGKNYCWPGAQRLAKYTGWSMRKVFHAIHVMGHETKWKRLQLDLPRPLGISYNPTKTRRRFRVRAVVYDVRQGLRWPRMRLTEEFAVRFRACASTKRREGTED
jgi:hypothetical protein